MDRAPPPSLAEICATDGDPLCVWLLDRWERLIDDDATPATVRRAALKDVSVLLDLPGAVHGPASDADDAAAVLGDLVRRGPLAWRARAALGLLREGETLSGLDVDAVDGILHDDDGA